MARENLVYLLMGVGTLYPNQWPLAENKTILLNPDGESVFTYHKTRLVPITDTELVAPGSGITPTANSLYGRIASTICYDLDFPDYIRQIGRANVDNLVVPTGDWQSVGLTHSHMAEFRAIENGVSKVRPARGGIFSAVDPYGCRLARMDENATEQRVMVAMVPFRGARTIYIFIGDLFTWLCLAGFLGTAAATWYREKIALEVVKWIDDLLWSDGIIN